ncbi:MAG: flagellar assembly protein FliH [Thermoanaerobacteraceae bacterium]|nr:flagellar assembly protein FliH [Thermoanaerobacteraceae bacterium]
MNEAVSKSREIIEKSKAEARELISKAKAQKQKIEEDAFNKGYNSGFEAGKKEQEAIWKEYIREVNKVKQEIKNQNAVYMQHLEKECFRLSIAIAEKILGKTLELDGKYFLELIKKGIEDAGEEKDALIRISEADYEKVCPLVSELKNGQNSIALIKDPTLTSGDCIITGPNYEIDVGIHTQIENIAEALRELEVI